MQIFCQYMIVVIFVLSFAMYLVDDLKRLTEWPEFSMAVVLTRTVIYGLIWFLLYHSGAVSLVIS